MSTSDARQLVFRDPPARKAKTRKAVPKVSKQATVPAPEAVKVPEPSPMQYPDEVPGSRGTEPLSRPFEVYGHLCTPDDADAMGTPIFYALAIEVAANYERDLELNDE